METGAFSNHQMKIFRNIGQKLRSLHRTESPVYKSNALEYFSKMIFNSDNPLGSIYVQNNIIMLMNVNIIGLIHQLKFFKFK